MKIKSVCVFCGSRVPHNESFIELAARCGEVIGELGLTLVYGGGGTGLMGVVSKAANERGAEVVGIYPRFLHEREPLSRHVSEAFIVDSMFERKKIMIERSDAFIILPGGVGTLDEIFEIITLKTLEMLDKPLIFINKDGYWDTLNDMLRHIADNNLVSPHVFDSYRFVPTVEEAFIKLGFKL